MGLVRAIFCALIFWTGTALAAGGDQGRSDFERGRRLYFEKNYTAALPHLQRAYELSNKRASTIRALAYCELALDLRAEARTHLLEYLATTPRPADAPEIQKELDALDAQALQPENTLKPVERENEEEDFIWDATTRTHPPPPAEPDLTPPPPQAEPTLFERPVFWLILGGTLAAVGAATAIALASPSAKPYGGSQNEVLRR